MKTNDEIIAEYLKDICEIQNFGVPTQKRLVAPLTKALNKARAEGLQSALSEPFRDAKAFEEGRRVERIDKKQQVRKLKELLKNHYGITERSAIFTALNNIFQDCAEEGEGQAMSKVVKHN